jgi:hypothetical protein
MLQSDRSDPNLIQRDHTARAKSKSKPTILGISYRMLQPNLSLVLKGIDQHGRTQQPLRNTVCTMHPQLSRQSTVLESTAVTSHWCAANRSISEPLIVVPVRIRLLSETVYCIPKPISTELVLIFSHVALQALDGELDIIPPLPSIGWSQNCLGK